MPILPQTGDATPGFIRDAASLGSRLGLERVSRLCQLLGNPQDRVPVLHVAGTNGKGSICAMMAASLLEAGYKAGLYTSPYIHDLRECLRIGGEPIPEAELAAVAAEIEPLAARMAAEGMRPTQFELETAVAFQWFYRRNCDIAVIETGLGGRLDATNVISRPLVCVLASISLDHTAILGGTIEQIAREKCGILRPGAVTVAYPAQQREAWAVIRQSAEALGSALLVPDMGAVREGGSGLAGTDIVYRGLPLHIPLIGRHQVPNAVTAVEALTALRETHGYYIPDEAIAAGIGRTRMPMRQELAAERPFVLLDGAHNPEGLAALADTVRRCFSLRRTAVVMGMLADKDCEASIAAIAALCGRFIACCPANGRALPSAQAAEIARKYCRDVLVCDDYAGALSGAVSYAGADGAVVVCGSFYLAGPVRSAMNLI